MDALTPKTRHLLPDILTDVYVPVSIVTEMPQRPAPVLHPKINTHRCLGTLGDQGQMKVSEADTVAHVISSWTYCLESACHRIKLSLSGLWALPQPANRRHRKDWQKITLNEIKRGWKELLRRKGNWGNHIFGDEWGVECKARFLIPSDDNEGLALGFLVKKNIYREMQRKPGIHPMRKETMLEWSCVRTIWWTHY